jgi:GTP cyclohydrolase I
MSQQKTKKEQAATTRFASPLSKQQEALTNEEKISSIAHHFREIMRALGLDLEDPSLSKTPLRVAKMYVEEAFKGMQLHAFPDIELIEEPKGTHMGAPASVVISKCRFVSFCEHHFVPMCGQAFVGYIPNGKIIGLSKINRIVSYFAARPQLQERLTKQISDCLSTLLETENIACLIHAQHFCVTMRGIKDESSFTSTHFLNGIFSHDLVKREEFFRSVNQMLQQREFGELP